MKVIIRVDGSLEIGQGHISRCLNLATEFKKVSAKILFISKNYDDEYHKLIQKKGFQVKKINKNLSKKQDTDFTLKIIKKAKPSYIVLDCYDLNSEWEKRVSKYCKIIRINDFANKTFSKFYINSNTKNKNEIYKKNKKNKSKTKFLLGPRYNILHENFTKYRNLALIKFKKKIKVKKVLIFIGVYKDSLILLSRILSILNKLKFNHIKFQVILGNEMIFSSFKSKKFSNLNIKYFKSKKNLAKIIYENDYVIGSGGLSLWERICLGKKSISFITSDNQKDKGKFKLIDESQTIINKNISNKIISKKFKEALLPSKTLLTNEKIFSINDTYGTKRIVRSVLGKEKLKLSLEKAERKDLYIFYDWINNPIVRKNSVNKSLVSFKKHYKWFEKKINSNKSFLFLAKDNIGLPVGQVRFDFEKKTERVYVDISVDEICRGMGVGNFLLHNGIKKINTVNKNKFKIFAIVLKHNIASANLFKKNNFTLVDKKKNKLYFKLNN